MLYSGVAIAAAGGVVYGLHKNAAKNTKSETKGSNDGGETTKGVGYTPVEYKTVESQVEVYMRPQLIQ